MKNSSRFFNNPECQYFPCHKLSAKGTDDFNCLFCYCPLYALGDDCGGMFEYTDDNIKMCINCHLPHRPEFYGFMLTKLTRDNLVKMGRPI